MLATMQSSLLAACGTYIIIFTILTLVTFILPYFRDVKSLRRFPNAHPLAGITNLWIGYHAWKGDRYVELCKRHAIDSCEQNPILRIAPNQISFIVPEAIKDIHGHGSVIEKGWHYDFLASSHRHLADVVDRTEHKRKRRVLAAAFAQSQIETHWNTLKGKMEIFLSQMDAKCIQKSDSQDITHLTAMHVDYRRWAILFTQEFIAAIGFSVDLGFLQAGDDWTTAQRLNGQLYQVHYRDAIEGAMYRDSVLTSFPELYRIFVFFATTLMPSFRRYQRCAESFNDICRHVVRTRLQNDSPPDDMFQALLYSRSGQPHNYPFGELLAEAHVILNAGSDSTGIAMTNTIWYLIHNPSVLERLRTELDEVLEHSDVVAPFHKIKSLRYLRAVLDESMRMNAPSALTMPRKTPPEGATIAGHFIPGNVGVGTPTHALHMDPSIWGDPDNFRPERWLEPNAAQRQQCFLVFTTGPRGCIGKNVTYFEQYVMLASFVHRYDFVLAEKDFQPQRHETTVTLIDRLPILIWKREQLG